MAELAAARERANIARELHDIVANNVSVIVAQAATTQRTAKRLRGSAAGEPLGTAGAEPYVALAAIESLGRETLGDMRRLVGVLQSTGGESANEGQPRLDQLDALVANVAGAGTDVARACRADGRRRRRRPPASRASW